MKHVWHELEERTVLEGKDTSKGEREDRGMHCRGDMNKNKGDDTG